MTNEKAIKILDNMPIPSHYFILDKEPITFEEMAEAIEMAIEALKNERPHGEWVGINEYLKHIEETTGEKYKTSGLYNGRLFLQQVLENE